MEANGAFELWGRTLRVNAGLRYAKTEHEMEGFIRIPSTPPAATNLFGLRKEDYGRNTIDGEYSESAAVAEPRLQRERLAGDPLLGVPSNDPPQSRATCNRSPRSAPPAWCRRAIPTSIPTSADQLDGGLEWYFSEGSVLGGNLFYKEITGFVTRRNIPQPFRNAGIPLDTITDPTILALLPNGLDTVLLFNTPVNIEAVTYLKGAEVLYQQRLDKLLQGLGRHAELHAPGLRAAKPSSAWRRTTTTPLPIMNRTSLRYGCRITIATTMSSAS